MPHRIVWPIRPAVWVGAGITVLAAAGVLLWDRYGGAVFFEMIAAGIASCF
jgi:hypothetical protein